VLNPNVMRNVDFDRRHRLPSPIETPLRSAQERVILGKKFTSIEVSLRRCATTARSQGCGRVYTSWEVKRAHGCPHCGNRYFRGVDKPSLFTLLRLFILQLANSWRVFGPTYGRGWGNHD